MEVSPPVEYGVWVRYMCGVYEEVRVKVIEIGKTMFDKRANESDKYAKSGIIFSLFKKCDRSDVNKNRVVFWLSMCSLVLAKVFAKRLLDGLRGWACSTKTKLNFNRTG